MAYEAEILLDSVNQFEDRLTTFEVTLPRIVLSEFNTHRVFSRNSASSRAIPVEKQLTKVLDDPFIPIYWGVNQPGMQAENELDPKEQEDAEALWLLQRDFAILGAVAMEGGILKLKDEVLQDRVTEIWDRTDYPGVSLSTPVHKQIANRLLESFMWHTVITTATEWDNFFGLRANHNAQPEIQRAAYMMKALYEDSVPDLLSEEEWHMPLIRAEDEEIGLEALKMISAGRCARVSYLTHDGFRDPQKDIEMCEGLMRHGHMSPLEHIARPMTEAERVGSIFSGNFRGWHQYRKDIPNEDDFSKVVQLDKK